MTLESDSPRTELIKVESVQNGMSRDGMTPQYIVGYTWQYSQYPSNLYIPQSEAPDVIANFSGQAFETVVKIKQLYLKKNKDGSYKTGDRMYDYQWEVLAWESSDTPVSAPPVAEPSPTIAESLAPTPQVAPQARPTDENQMRIMRQSALKCASWLSVPTVESMGIETSANKSIEIAEKFMQYFITGQVPSELDELLEDIE
tara:strand:- start:238 stop:840 length:603 start_codon:yes stop_codon:yes gene_type:complete